MSAALTISNQETNPAVAQRIIIKYLAREEIPTTEIFHRLTRQSAEQSLSKICVFFWSKQTIMERQKRENACSGLGCQPGRFFRLFFNRKGNFPTDFLQVWRTIDAAYSCEHFSTVVSLQKTKPTDSRGILLHHNARPHTAVSTVEKINEMHQTQVDHPLYNPALSLCDVHYCGPHKKALGEQRRWDDEGAAGLLRIWLLARPASIKDTGVKNHPSFWEKCVSIAEKYVEK